MNDFPPTPPEPELEALFQRQFKNLPLRKAPATLGPRVLAALQAKEQVVWWHQAFWAWPRLAQTALVIFLLPLSGAFFYFGWFLGSSDAVHNTAQRFSTNVTGLWEGLATLTNAVGLVMRIGIQPWLLMALVLSFAMYLICLGAGTAFLRLAYKKL